MSRQCRSWSRYFHNTLNEYTRVGVCDLISALKTGTRKWSSHHYSSCTHRPTRLVSTSSVRGTCNSAVFSSQSHLWACCICGNATAIAAGTRLAASRRLRHVSPRLNDGSSAARNTDRSGARFVGKRRHKSGWSGQRALARCHELLSWADSTALQVRLGHSANARVTRRSPTKDQCWHLRNACVSDVVYRRPETRRSDGPPVALKVVLRGVVFAAVQQQAVDARSFAANRCWLQVRVQYRLNSCYFLMNEQCLVAPYTVIHLTVSHMRCCRAPLPLASSASSNQHQEYSYCTLF